MAYLFFLILNLGGGARFDKNGRPQDLNDNLTKFCEIYLRTKTKIYLGVSKDEKSFPIYVLK
jgi:hypothetical protein